MASGAVEAGEAFDLVQVAGDVFARPEGLGLLQEAGGFVVLTAADKILGVLDEGTDFVLFDLSGAFEVQLGFLTLAAAAIKPRKEDQRLAVQRVLLDEFIEETGGLVVLLLGEETAGDTEFPIEVVGSEQQGLAVGSLGGEIIFPDQVTITEGAVDVAVFAAQLERTSASNGRTRFPVKGGGVKTLRMSEQVWGGQPRGCSAAKLTLRAPPSLDSSITRTTMPALAFSSTWMLACSGAWE